MNSKMRWYSVIFKGKSKCELYKIIQELLS
jgi:hypothetical protein